MRGTGALRTVLVCAAAGTLLGCELGFATPSLPIAEVRPQAPGPFGYPVLSITGRASPLVLSAGELVTFRWTVTNRSPVPHHDTRLHSFLGTGWAMTHPSDKRCQADDADPASLTCALGALQVGQSTEVVITALTGVDTAPGQASVSASTSSEHLPADAPAPYGTVIVTVRRAGPTPGRQESVMSGRDGRTVRPSSH